MPRVTMSDAEEQRRYLQRVIKSRMAIKGISAGKIPQLVGTSKVTSCRRLNDTATLDKMPLEEFKRYVKVLDISDEDLIYAIKGGTKPC